MLSLKKNRGLIKAVAFAFAVQCVGSSFTPVVSFAHSIAIETGETDTSTPSASIADAEAAYKEAQASEETIKAALGGIIELKDEDDDLEFLNKVYQLMTDTTGKTTQTANLNALIAVAQSSKKDADASGTPVSANTQAILDMAERLGRISAEAEKGTLAYTDSMKNNDIKIYTAAVSELKTCNAKAEVAKAKGQETTACAMTDAQKAAYQRLINNNAIVEAVKKATQQVNQTSETNKTTNAIDATPSSSSSSSTTTTKKLSCYEGTVLAGEGKCCPTATPIYDKGSGVCVVATQTTQKKKSSSDDDGMQKVLMWMMMNRNIGAENDVKMCLIDCDSKTGGGRSPEFESGNGADAKLSQRSVKAKQNQYSFNYSIKQDEKGSAITYLPVNSDDVKFIVAKSPHMIEAYNKVAAEAKKAAADAKDGKADVNEKISIKVPAVFGMNDNNPSVVHYIEVPLEFGKWKDLFKDDLKAGIQWNYQNYTNLLRVPASSFNSEWKYYTAVVVYEVKDNFGHSQNYQFYVPFDFTDTSTRIGAALDTKKADIEVPSVATDDNQSISVEGTVKDASFDAKTGKCTININGTAVDDKTQETQEGVTLPYTTGALTQSECAGLAEGTKIVVSGTDIKDSALAGGSIYSDKLAYRGTIGDNGLSADNTITINGRSVSGFFYKIDEATGSLILTKNDGKQLTESEIAALNKHTGNDASSYEMCNKFQGDTDICAVYADGRREKINSNANAKESLNTYESQKTDIGKRTKGVDGGTVNGISSVIKKVSDDNASVAKSIGTTFEGIKGVATTGTGTVTIDGHTVKVGLDDFMEMGKNVIFAIKEKISGFGVK